MSNLIALPGPTLLNGVPFMLRDELRDATHQLAEVIELPVVKGADLPGAHQGHYRDHDRSFADCLCEDVTAILAGRPCPKHHPWEYARLAKHLPEVSA